MKNLYTDAEIESTAKHLNVDTGTARKAREATDDFEKMVSILQEANPNFHHAKCVVDVLETPEGKRLYAEMHPEPASVSKPVRVRVILLDQARTSIEDTVKEDVSWIKDSSVINCALKILIDSIDSNSTETSARVLKYFDAD